MSVLGMALLPLLFLFFNHSIMAVTDWLTAISMVTLAVMAVIAVNDTYNFLPWPRRRPPPRPLDELVRLSDTLPERVRELETALESVVEALDLIILANKQQPERLSGSGD